MYVESGYSSECAKKRNASNQWEDTVNELLRVNPNARPDALVSGDNCYCYLPNLGQHPPWAYSSGRVVVELQRTTQTSRVPQGPLHPAAGMSDVWGGNPWGSDAIPVEPMPKATRVMDPSEQGQMQDRIRRALRAVNRHRHQQHRRRNQSKNAALKPIGSKFLFLMALSSIPTTS